MGERRGSVRVPLGVYANEAVGEDLLRAFATDVSPAGIYVERVPGASERLLHRWGERVQIEVPLPGLGETIWAAARVIHDRTGGLYHGTALRFTGMAKRHREAVLAYVYDARRAPFRTVRKL